VTPKHSSAFTTRRALLAALACAAGVVAIDQASKYWVVEHLRLREIGSVDVSSILNFRMAWNTGINFGLLAGDGQFARWLLIVLIALAGVALLLAALRKPSAARAVGFGIAAGGAFGNLIDRLRYGAVADFLNISCCGLHNPWSFNLADIAVFAGLGLVLLTIPAKSA